ncbi:MAG: hypothetical protein M1814_006468 [Vezdaea aestivalis]|nr:MAG: hypothetical protein M1814_006468 [Vezdaea aestivalis]
MATNGARTITLLIKSPSTGVSSDLKLENILLSATVNDIKEKLNLAIPTRPALDRLRLIYRGRALVVDGESIANVLQHELVSEEITFATIHLVLRPADPSEPANDASQSTTAQQPSTMPQPTSNQPESDMPSTSRTSPPVSPPDQIPSQYTLPRSLPPRLEAPDPEVQIRELTAELEARMAARAEDNWRTANSLPDRLPDRDVLQARQQARAAAGQHGIQDTPTRTPHSHSHPYNPLDSRVYLLSSPSGPSAIVMNQAATYTFRAAPPTIFASAPPSRFPPRIHSTPPAIPPGPPAPALARLPNRAAVRAEAIFAAHAGPARLRAQRQQRRRLNLPAHLWLVFRLAAGFFLLASGSSRRRAYSLLPFFLIAYLYQAGFLGPVERRLRPFRASLQRYMFGLDQNAGVERFVQQFLPARPLAGPQSALVWAHRTLVWFVASVVPSTNLPMLIGYERAVRQAEAIGAPVGDRARPGAPQTPSHNRNPLANQPRRHAVSMPSGQTRPLTNQEKRDLFRRRMREGGDVAAEARRSVESERVGTSSGVDRGERRPLRDEGET